MAQAPSTARLIASVVIMKDGKVLVLHEPDDNGGMRFNTPGGHVEPGEGIPEAAVREAREETGLEIVVGRLVQIISSSWTDGTHSVRQTFEVKVVGGELRPEEGSELIWMFEEEVASSPSEKFVFGVKDALMLAFKRGYIPSENAIFRNNVKKRY